MQTAVIYARYSSDAQTEQSIEGQLRVCEEYAKSHDIMILDTYIDRAMTGTNDNRPDFQRMIKDSNKRQWNYVLVYKLDRFSRNKYEMAMHKKTLKDNGIKVISATEFIPDTPEGIIFESMLEGYAEYYSAELSQKVRRGMNESRRKGNLTGGRIPYGYKNVDKKAVIFEEQAEVIRYIFEQYAKGEYVRNIIADLTAKGIYYYGKPFGRTTIYKILKNERYSGIYRYNDEVFENIYPQIVPTDIYEIVRKKVENNKYGKNSIAVDYLLKHKMKCGYCGQSMNAESGTSQNGERKYYYKCNGRKTGSNCKKTAVQKDFLENMVIDAIITELNNQQTMQSVVKGLMAIQEQQLKLNSALSVLTKEKRQVESSIDNIMSAIEKGVVTSTTTKRLKALEEQLENLEKQILIEKSKAAIKLTESEIKDFYEQALRYEPKMLINFLVKEIMLFDDKIEIYFNSPLTINTSPDENQGFIFYTKNLSFALRVPQRRNLAKFNFVIEFWIK
jgi:DNA invertase Pin-like site-specific DNA recombinase